MSQTTDRQNAVPPAIPDDREAIAAVEGGPRRKPRLVEPEDAGSVADTDAPLLDSELEEGIASIFAELHTATAGSDEDADETGDLATVDISTFRLLGELDRIWHRAA